MSFTAPCPRFAVRLIAAALLLLAPAAALPVSAQEASSGTGVLWRTLDVRPLNCTFSPDGTRLACGSWGKGTVENIAVIDTETGKVLRSFGKEEFGERQPELLAWSPDGKHLAAATNALTQSETDPRGAVYESGSGQLVRSLKPELSNRITALAFGSDGMRLSAASLPYVYRWTMSGEKPLEKVELDMDGYGGEAVSFTSSAEQLVTGRKEVLLWDGATGKQLATFPKADAADRMGALAFSPDGRLLAGRSAAGKTVVWDAAAQTHVATLEAPPTGGTTSNGQPIAPAFLGPHRLATYDAAAKQIRLWKLPAGKQVLAFEAAPANAMTWHGDRFVLAGFQRPPLALRTLCRGDVPCGKEEGLTPGRLKKLLPATVAGLARAMAQGRWGARGPSAQAMYMGEAGGLEMEINSAGEEDLAQLRREWETRAKKEGMFKKTHHGYTVYGGGDAKGTGLVVPLSRAVVAIEGTLSAEKMLEALDAAWLGEVEALTTGAKGAK